MEDEPVEGEDGAQSDAVTEDDSEPERDGPSPHDDSGRSRFRRARDDRYLGGVAGGAGRRLGIDPLVFRVGFAVSAVWWPVTPLVYATLWLTVREEGAERSLLGSIRRPGGLRRVASVVALGIGATAVRPGLSGDGGGVRLGLLLLAAGAVLILGHPGGLGPDPVPYGSPSGTPTGRVGAPRLDQLSTLTPGPPQGPGRRRSGAGEERGPAWLGWLVFWLVVLLGGAALALDRADASIRPGVVVSIALLVVAVTLLVGAFRGRARLLIPLGVLLSPLWLGFSIGAIPRYEDDGRIAYTPEKAADIEDRYTHGYGRLRLDLTDVAWASGETREIELGLTAGVVEVWVPSDVDVELDAAIGIGAGEVLHRWDGTHVSDIDSVQPDFWLGHGTMSLNSPARPPTCEESYELTGDPNWDRDPYTDSDLVPPPQDGDPYGDDEEWELVHRDPEGRPCGPQPAPENPAAVKLDVQIGIGSVEVRHVETPA